MAQTKREKAIHAKIKAKKKHYPMSIFDDYTKKRVIKISNQLKKPENESSKHKKQRLFLEKNIYPCNKCGRDHMTFAHVGGGNVHREWYERDEGKGCIDNARAITSIARGGY